MRCKVALNLLRDSVLRSQSLTILNLNRPKEQDDNAQDQPHQTRRRAGLDDQPVGKTMPHLFSQYRDVSHLED